MNKKIVAIVLILLSAALFFQMFEKSILEKEIEALHQNQEDCWLNNTKNQENARLRLHSILKDVINLPSLDHTGYWISDSITYYSGNVRIFLKELSNGDLEIEVKDIEIDGEGEITFEYLIYSKTVNVPPSAFMYKSKRDLMIEVIIRMVEQGHIQIVTI